MGLSYEIYPQCTYSYKIYSSFPGETHEAMHLNCFYELVCSNSSMNFHMVLTFPQNFIHLKEANRERNRVTQWDKN